MRVSVNTRKGVWQKIAPVFLAALWCAAWTGPPAAAAADDPKALDQAFGKLAAYKFGQSRLPLTTVGNAVRESLKDAKARKPLERRLAALLGAGATPDCKRFVCRQLQIIGSADSVPALARLLDDETLSHMARYALERMQDASAGEALRKAMDRLSGKLLIGVVNSVGQRRDPAAADKLIELMGGKDEAVAAAAAAALGNLGGPKAANALAAARDKASPRLRAVLTDASLRCADRLVGQGRPAEAVAIYRPLHAAGEPTQVRVAALRGLVAAGDDKAPELLVRLLGSKDPALRAAAAGCIRLAPGEAASKTFAAALPKLTAAGQVMLLDALAERGEAGLEEAVLAATRHADEAVRDAAARALGSLGDASAVAALAKLAVGGGKTGDAARGSLARLRGKDVDRTMLALLVKADAPLRRVLLASLGARRSARAIPAMLAAAGDADESVRLAGVAALGEAAGAGQLPDLVALVVKAPSDAERQAAEKAVLSACGRAADKDRCAAAVLSETNNARGPARAALFRLAGRIGGRRALKALLATTNDADAEVADAAVRALSAWPDPSPADELLRIARTSKRPNRQILALRGYVRMARMGRRQTDSLLKMYADALALAHRPEEKKLVLGGLAGLGDPRALKMVAPMLAEKSVAREAAAAADRLLRHAGRGDKKAWAQALDMVIEKTADKKLRQRAEQMLGTLRPKSGAKKASDAPPAMPPLGALAGSAFAAPAAGREEVPQRDPARAAAAEKLGWRLGVQAYSFRQFTFYEAVEKTASLGLKYIEMYPGQRIGKANKGRIGHAMGAATRAEIKKTLAAAGVKVVCYGVIGMGRNEAEHRKVFDFARKMGIETINTETHPTELLDRLCNEYRINLALHNHPRTWPPDKVLAACKGRSKRIGACADTGHWMRAGLKPLECLRKLKGRIISLHFKDLNKTGGGHDVPWGTGAGNVKAMLTELHRQGFRGVFSIEYEHNWSNSVPDMARCVAYFDRVAAELAAK